jgi:glycosyltransferase involved in cell wall biosynthesis
MAFNHELFIRDTLDGFLMQQTNFPYEILIHDDASTDKTADIIREYDEKFPGIIRPIYQVENQWLKGNKGSALHNFHRAKGKYIALCEGDDYWTDPGKLQRQVDFMEANAGYSMVAENGLIVNSTKKVEKLFNDIEESDISIPSMLKIRQFPTASVLFKVECLDARFYELKLAGDTSLWCYFAMKGKIRYLPVVSSVYRRAITGMVESTGKLKWAMLMEDWNKQISDILPADFDRKIFNTRNFAEYMTAFFFSVRDGKWKNALVALKKCLKFEPMRTLKSIVAVSFRSVFS